MARETPSGTTRMCLFYFLIVEMIIKKIYILSSVTGSSELCHLSLRSIYTEGNGIAVDAESRRRKNGTIGRK